MNSIFHSIILGAAALGLSACAMFSTAEQQYSKKIQIESTRSVCANLNAILDAANLKITDINPHDNFTASKKTLPVRKLLIATTSMESQGARLNDTEIPTLHNYFCKYPYYFVGKPWNRTGGDTNYYFLKEPRIAEGFSNIVAPSPRLESPHVLERLSPITQTVSANKPLFLDKIAAIGLDKPIDLTFTVKYPNTLGTLKSEAKKMRKDHFEKEIGKIFEYISYVPYMSPKVDGFLKSNTPGPFQKGDLATALDKFKSFRQKYNLDGVGAWVKPELYEYESDATRAGISDRDAHLKLLMDDDFRRELFGFLLQAESEWTFKRVSKSEVLVSVHIDIPSILKSYKMSNIADLTE